MRCVGSPTNIACFVLAAQVLRDDLAGRLLLRAQITARHTYTPDLKSPPSRRTIQ
jgi:hypothetical protein